MNTRTRRGVESIYLARCSYARPRRAGSARLRTIRMLRMLRARYERHRVVNFASRQRRGSCGGPVVDAPRGPTVFVRLTSGRFEAPQRRVSSSSRRSPSSARGHTSGSSPTERDASSSRSAAASRQRLRRPRRDSSPTNPGHRAGVIACVVFTRRRAGHDEHVPGGDQDPSATHAR